jgi:putative transposase
VPRKPRIFVAAGTYHVYCRVVHGERPLAEETVAAVFVFILAAIKREYGLTVLAWCLMPNHYYLALRAGELPLRRSRRLVQGRFAKAFNRSRRVFGPVWQGGYKARLAEDPTHLMMEKIGCRVPIRSDKRGDGAASSIHSSQGLTFL